MKIIFTYFLLLCLSINLIVKDINSIEFESPKVEIITKFNTQNIIYRGITNSIVIKAKKNIKYEASGIGLEKIDDLGNYKLYPRSGKEVVIKVIINQANGKVFEISKPFEIRDIGIGVSKINGKSCKKCELKLSKKELSTSRVSFGFPDLLIDGLSSKIVSFKIKLPGKGVKKVFGNRMTSTLLLYDIQRLKRGSQVQIFDIHTKTLFPANSAIRVCKIPPIIIKITN